MIFSLITCDMMAMYSLIATSTMFSVATGCVQIPCLLVVDF